MTVKDVCQSTCCKSMQLTGGCEFLSRQPSRSEVGPSQGLTWLPAVDIYETGEALIVLVALPGVQTSVLVVELDSGLLRVVGERARPIKPSSVVQRLEIPFGRFERHIDLPQGHFEIGKRELENGLLRLVLRKLV